MNKPKAFNSLSIEMIHRLRAHSALINSNENPKVVWLEGTGPKAFCAGGDVKALYLAKQSQSDNDRQLLADFFRYEYLNDYQMANLKAIQISAINGIIMGGGVGVSIHSPIKIATEKSFFAMPEAKIGLFTDVSAGYFLSKLPVGFARYLALTGARLKGKELVQHGIANFYVNSEKLTDLYQDIGNATNVNIQLQDLQRIVNKYSDRNIPNGFDKQIIGYFQGNTWQEFENNRKGYKNDKLDQILAEQCPISLRVIFDYLQKTKNLTLKEVFEVDYRLATRFMQGTDFFEGVRCALVDKGDSPKWSYTNPNDIPQSEVDKYFERLPDEQELFGKPEWQLILHDGIQQKL